MQPEAARHRDRHLIGRLAACAFAAGIILGSPLAARADSIVYSGPLNETVTAPIPDPNSTSTSGLVLNLGSVGAATFVGDSADVRSTYCVFTIIVCLENGYRDDLSTNVNLTLSGVYADVDGAGAILPLSVGTGIGSGDNFQSLVASLVDQTNSTYESTNLFGFIPLGSEVADSAGGPLPDDHTPYFLGLEIPAGGGTYDYGWIEMENSTSGPAAVTILGYAYDDTAGAGIQAGEISNDTLIPVPEPGSLSLILAALGALAFVAWRTRARPYS